MKKQILFLTLFVAAILGGMNAKAQYWSDGSYINFPIAPDCIAGTPLNCLETAGELSPLPGITYTYTVTTTTATDDVRWFVINNKDLKANNDSIIESNGALMNVEDYYPTAGAYLDPANGDGLYILSLGTNNEYNYTGYTPADETDDGVSATGSGTDHSIDIAWKSFDGDSPEEVLLVAIVSDATGCTNNIEVYRIVPVFQFTLDIATLSDAGDSISNPTSDPADYYTECVSPIESVGYNVAASPDENTPGKGTLTVNYGENWVYFVINASNFVDSWLPQFQISTNLGTGASTLGTNAGTVGITAQWAYQDDDFADENSTQTWYDITDGGSGTWTTTQPVIAGGRTGQNLATPNAVGDGVVPTNGSECIIVRVRLDWGTDAENAIDPVTLSVAVDGVMFDANDTDGGLANQFDFANTSLKDLGEATAANGPCVDDGFTNDVVPAVITPRPQVLDATGTAAENFELNTGDHTGGTLNDPNTGANN